MNVSILATCIMMVGATLAGCSATAAGDKVGDQAVKPPGQQSSGALFSTRKFSEGDRTCDVLVGRNQLPVTRYNKGTGQMIGYAVGRCPKSEPLLANINLYSARSFELSTYTAVVYRDDKKRNKSEKIFIREKNRFNVYSFVTTKLPLSSL